MNILFRRFGATITASALPLLAACSGADAAFNPAHAPADAKWLLYFDFNALRASAFGQELTTIANQVSGELHDLPVQVDIPKVLATLGAATAYGTNFSDDPSKLDGTLVLQGAPELRTIAEGFVAQLTVTQPDSITQLKDLPFEAYTINNELTVAFPPEPVILVSRSRAQLVRARELMQGRGESLARSSSPLAGLLPRNGNPFLVAATVVPSGEEFGHDGPQARILQLARSGSIAIGEEGPLTAARIQLVATSDETGDKLMKIVQGVAAMASLAETSDRQLGEFLKSVNISRNGPVVTLSLSHPSARIMEMVRHVRAEGRRESSSSSRPPIDPDATVLAEWVADQDLGGNAASPATLTTRTIEGVSLRQGALIMLLCQKHDGEQGRFDYLEITAADGGQPLRFEAEYMRLQHYRVEKAGFGSGGEIIMLTGDSGQARQRFPGADGIYTLKVAYIDENDGKSHFSVAVKNPSSTTAAAPE